MGLVIINEWTSLQCAAFYGHYSIVEFLINHGADINAKLKFIFGFFFQASPFIPLQAMAIFLLLNISLNWGQM